MSRKIHELKTWPEVYPYVAIGSKKVEIRLNDRDFAVDDVLVLREFDPVTGKYSGAQCDRRVTHVLEGGQFGLEEGYVALSVEPLPMQFTDEVRGAA